MELIRNERMLFTVEKIIFVIKREEGRGRGGNLNAKLHAKQGMRMKLTADGLELRLDLRMIREDEEMECGTLGSIQKKIGSILSRGSWERGLGSVLEQSFVCWTRKRDEVHPK